MRVLGVLLIAVVSAVVASIATYFAFLRPRIRAWGFDPQEAELALPGDELVAEPTAVETRGITIDAPPRAVWPWLVQMGYGRGGWYSYEPLDSKLPSAKEILPEFQELKVGDKMPTYPGFSFEVKTVEPEHSIVLFADAASTRSQMMDAARAEVADNPDIDADEVAEAVREMPDFAGSWAFVLQPEGEDKTRLIERFRVQAPSNAPAAIAREAMGTGIVLMARKQLLGIKERVEQAPPQDDLQPEMAPAG
jgi:uncharacterized protein YndB with AHSA1/START domain